MKILKIIISFVFLFLTALPARAEFEYLTKPLTLEDWEVQFSGYVQSAITTQKKNSEFSWQRSRSRLIFTSPESAIGGLVEFELVNADLLEANWLQMGYLTFAVDKRTELRIGRLFLAAPRTAPGPFALETVQYAKSNPFPSYAYGFQLVKKFDENWKLLMDVSGADGKPFRSDENWEYLSSSFRLENVFNPGKKVAAMGQFGKEYWRLGMDGELLCSEKKCKLKGGIYTRQEQGINCLSGYAFFGLNVLEWMEVHTQIDGVFPEDNDQQVIWTNGIRVWTRGKVISVTVDYEYSIEVEDNKIFCRAQVRW